MMYELGKCWVCILVSAALCPELLPTTEGAALGAAKRVRSTEQIRAQIEKHISALGADEFAAREAAVEQLRRIGEQLLFEPELNGAKDLSNLDRFHNCFIVPLGNACTSDDAEIRQRARKPFSEYSPEHPIGKGPDGWALSAVHVLLRHVKQPTFTTDYLERHGTVTAQ